MKPYEPQPADILCFSGRGWTSWAIKTFTHWPWDQPKISHVSVVAHTSQELIEKLAAFTRLVKIPEERISGWQEQLLMFESTTLNDRPCEITGQMIKGVQAHKPLDRIEAYDGDVYYCRLTRPYRAKFESNGRQRRLSIGCLARIGDAYNGRGAALSGTHLTLRLRDHFWAWSKTDRTRLFCSQYLASVLSPIDLFPIDDPRKWNPARLLKKLVSSGVYKPPKRVEI